MIVASLFCWLTKQKIIYVGSLLHQIKYLTKQVLCIQLGQWKWKLKTHETVNLFFFTIVFFICFPLLLRSLCAPTTNIEQFLGAKPMQFQIKDMTIIHKLL